MPINVSLPATIAAMLITAASTPQMRRTLTYQFGPLGIADLDSFCRQLVTLSPELLNAYGDVVAALPPAPAP